VVIDVTPSCCLGSGWATVSWTAVISTPGACEGHCPCCQGGTSDVKLQRFITSNHSHLVTALFLWSLVMHRPLRPSSWPGPWGLSLCLSVTRPAVAVSVTDRSSLTSSGLSPVVTWLLGWTWVGAIAVDNDYGRLAIQVFEEEIRGTGVCLAFFETLNRANLVRDVKRAADMVQASTARRHSPTWGSSFTCSLPYNISPAELLQHLNQVNFTTPLGEPFYFRGADVPAVYLLVNWQATPQGLLKLVTIGRVDGSNLLINQSAIQWNTGSNMVPVSVCSDSCPPGTRVARKKGEPVCCFECISCAEGEVSNTTGSLQCDWCPLEFWSNSHRTACVPRQLEFLSFNDVMGVTLTTVAVCGAVATVAVFMFFVYHRHTPLVWANNSELSFLLLLSLKLCFLCSLVFIGRPSVWACRIRQAAFGVIFVLCLSCLLVKTIVVLAAFRSARPGAGQLMRCFGPVQQRGSVFLFTSVQVIICAVWLSMSSLLPYRDLGLKGSKVILECEVGSVVGFSLVLGYIGLLASLCLLLAFLARNSQTTSTKPSSSPSAC
ncbi:unnamed protein product, partial [Oncorhynchus mykiss]